MKTVLAPNAPWPKPTKIKKVEWKGPKVKINSGSDLDYFAQACEELQAIKDSKKSGARNVASGRLKGDNRLSG